MKRVRFLIYAIFFLSACRPYTPAVPALPEQYSPPIGLFEDLQRSYSDEETPFWWESFSDPDLKNIIDLFLAQNLSIQSAAHRLSQVKSQSAIQESFQYPQADLRMGASRSRTERPGNQITGIESAPAINRIFNTFSLGVRASYEFDIWKRLDSLTTALHLRTEAADAELQSLVSVLLAETVRAWLDLRLQAALVKLVNAQRVTSATYLTLTRMRFRFGLVNGLDVLQQEQQLASLEAILPSIEQLATQAHTRLATLLGTPRTTFAVYPVAPLVLELPPLPGDIRVQEILDRRPDLQALKLKAFASEYDIAAALAERFPSIGLGISYEFSTEDMNTLFESEAGTFGPSFTLPLFDGGRRRASVDLQEAKARESLNEFLAGYLQAMNELSSLIEIEKLKREQVEKLAVQYKAAKNTLRYSRERYQNGALNYLQVLLALQSVQEIERIYLQEKTLLLQNRVSLYQSIGQPWKVRIIGDSLLSLYLPKKDSNGIVEQ